MSGFASLRTDTGNIRVHYEIPLYETQGAFFNVTQYPYHLSNSFQLNNDTYGTRFGSRAHIYNIDFPLHLSFDRGESLKAQGHYRISTPGGNAPSLKKDLKTKI